MVNPHTTPEFQEIADRGVILQTQVGSGVHGTAIAGTDDRDEMGVCVEPPEYVIGLKRFEQYIYRTATVRTGRDDEPSQAGDLDLVVYSLRKWMRLALAGNPTVLVPLFTPDSEVVRINAWGWDLRANSDMIVSRQAGAKFLGYLRGQRERMLNGTVDRRVNRPLLVARHGFDTKYAAHMVRLGVQGVELLSTGRITLPMPQPWLQWIRDLRLGNHTAQEAIDATADLEAALLGLIESSELPPAPQVDRANKWLTNVYEHMWDTL
jgi:hypothetical protein